MPFGTAVEDPVVLEQEKEVFVVDSDIDRNDESALLAFLQPKYGTLPLMKFDLGYLSASVLVGGDVNEQGASSLYDYHTYTCI